MPQLPGGGAGGNPLPDVLAAILTGRTYWTDYPPEMQAALLTYLDLNSEKSYNKQDINQAIMAAAKTDPRLVAAISTAVQQPGAKGAGTAAGGSGGTSTTTNADGSQTISIPGVGDFTIPAYNDPNATTAEEDNRGVQKSKNIRDRNLAGGFEGLLSSYGIPITPNLQSLIDQAVNKQYSEQTFLNYLRQTPEYQDEFTGIFEKDGTLKMSEAEYMAQKKQYEAIATQAGINWGEKRADWAFTNDVSPEEFSDRAEAITKLRENKEFYTQFARSLVQSGLASPKEINQEGILKFVLGEGNKAWYEELNLAQSRYAATQAGIKLGEASAGAYSHINPGQIQKIADKGLSPEQLQAQFQQTAQDLITTLPEARIQSYGLTKKKILAARFGGKNQAEILQLMEHIKQQESAFYQDRASASIYATAEGVQTLGGSGSKAAQ